MRVCFIAEGCYPYSVGGVSSWINSMIKMYPNIEFVLVTIIPDRSFSGKFVYDLPDNLVEVYETYLQDDDWSKNGKKIKKLKLKENETKAIRDLVFGRDCDWDCLFELCNKKKISVNDLLMGTEFFHAVTDLYDREYPEIPYTDFLWTMRSICLPLFLLLKSEIPKADIYHSVATGYAGVIGCMAKHLYGGSLIISEHGIYTREREEDLIRANWLRNEYKDIWINQFHIMSNLAYSRADIVTSLFAHARELQMELGCNEEKTIITPNGINVDNFKDIPGKTENDDGYINIGSVMRISPIKDVKTMLLAFSHAKKEIKNLRLWLMGPEDDEQYAKECHDLVEILEIQDVIFTGMVKVSEYLGRMDFMVLTSISEGQPLTILESYAAKKPVIATDVGNCRGLIYGELDDELGSAGILTHIMNVDEISKAMVELALSPQMRERMGEVGYQRLLSKYKIDDMRKSYINVYKQMADLAGCKWNEDTFSTEVIAPSSQN